MSRGADMADEAGYEIRRMPVAIIGAGAVGRALAARMYACGYAIDAVISPDRADAEALAAQVEAGVASAAIDALPADVQTIFCCVPDDAIDPLADELAALPQTWHSRLVAHTSGVHTHEVLEPLPARGAEAMSFHPLQSFTRATPPAAFEDIYIGIEGTAAAIEVGRKLAVDLGARPLEIPAGAKVRYHLAASIASNFLVTLVHMAGDVLSSAGMTEPPAAELLRPLVEQTWAHLLETSPQEALTGPIRRGDRGTVEAHLEALQAHLPRLANAYRELAAVTADLAEEGGLAEEHARAVRDAVAPPQV